MRLYSSRGFRLVSVLVVIILASGCRSDDAPLLEPTDSPPVVGLDSPVDPESPIATPGVVGALDSGRRNTALQSLSVAQEQAVLWNPKAMWTAILPTTLVASNLGLPLRAEGWFFKFELPDSPVEYFIHIQDMEVTGSSEAQPLIEPPDQYVPLNHSELRVDSNELFAMFLASDKGKQYLATARDPEWEFRLVHLDGQEYPVWSLFDAKDLTVSLINVNAISGETAKDPYQ